MDELQWLIDRGREWVREQRELHIRDAVVLPPQLIARVSSFFEESVFGRARMKVVEEISNPAFYSELMIAGEPIPIDFSQMAGIVFKDIILLSMRHMPKNDTIPLFFHELVHIVQYQYLGIDKYVDLYVRGWAMHNRLYNAIPLEEHAYKLQERFEAREAFDVNAEVKAYLQNY